MGPDPRAINKAFAAAAEHAQNAKEWADCAREWQDSSKELKVEIEKVKSEVTAFEEQNAHDAEELKYFKEV